MRASSHLRLSRPVVSGPVAIPVANFAERQRFLNGQGAMRSQAQNRTGGRMARVSLAGGYPSRDVRLDERAGRRGGFVGEGTKSAQSWPRPPSPVEKSYKIITNDSRLRSNPLFLKNWPYCCLSYQKGWDHPTFRALRGGNVNSCFGGRPGRPNGDDRPGLASLNNHAGGNRADDGCRTLQPILLILALSALSWAVFIAIVMATWSTL